MVFINGCEIKQWFLRINYNAKNYLYDKEYLGNFYYISANISDDIKNLFLEKIGNSTSEYEYAGAVLQVNEKDGITLGYYLNVFVVGKGNYNGYLVGYLSAAIINTTFDWEKYIKSKKYIDINIPTENVVILNQITQGFKNENIYSNTRAIIYDNGSSALTEFLDEKYRVRNICEIIENKVEFKYPNFYEYFYLSRTPSICVLANSICKLSKSIKLNVSKENNKKIVDDKNIFTHI